VVDENGCTVLGGESDAIGDRLREGYQPNLSLAEALKAAVAALSGGDRQIVPADLEVAVLSRDNGRRAFRRLADEEIGELLGVSADEPPAGEAELEAPTPATSDADAADSDADATPTRQPIPSPPRVRPRATARTRSDLLGSSVVATEDPASLPG
jgi:proteasome alpha subunit